MHQCPTCPDFRKGNEPNKVLTLRKEHAGFVAMGQVCCAECYVLIYDAKEPDDERQLILQFGDP